MKTMKLMVKTLAVTALFAGTICASGFEAQANDAGKTFGSLDLAGKIEMPVPLEMGAVPAAGEKDAEAGALDAVFEYFEKRLGKKVEPPVFEDFSAMPEKSGAKSSISAGEILYTIKLEEIKNAYLKSGITFTTTKGAAVHVSGTKANNCPDGGNKCAEKDKYFLSLTTEKGETYLVRAMEIANFSIFMSGSKNVVIDGETYTLKAYAKLSAPENSALEIKRNGQLVFKKTAKEVADAIAAKSLDVKLSRLYNLAYGNEILQGPGGVRFTEKMYIAMVPPDEPQSYYMIDVSKISSGGVTLPEMEKVSFGFRLLEGMALEIYRIN